MKFLVALTLIAAVASASIIPPAVIASDNAEIQEIVAAIQSPSTDPATAAALEEMLLQILGIGQPEPIHVGPAIVDNYEPISIGPALIDFPLPDGGALTEVPATPVMPAPVGPSASAPLVQIILNINAAANVAGSPVAIETVPSPVQVVEDAAVIIDRPVPETSIIPAPVLVVDEAAVIIDRPVPGPSIIPAPVINLPEILN